MIKKYNIFINEKLSDKLSGFDESGIKQQFLNGDIDIARFYELCQKYNFNMNDELIKEKIKTYTLKQILSNTPILIKIFRYYNLFKLIIDNVIYSQGDLNKFLMQFSSRDDVEYVEYLINKGADVNAYDGAILSNTIFYENYNVLKCLLEHGAIVTDKILKQVDFPRVTVNNEKLKILVTKNYNEQHDKEV